MPTEAEWEYAARGGQSYRYAGDDDLDVVGWYAENRTKPVHGKKENGYGLYDMSGNVWEWCWDWYEAYPSEAQTNPAGPESGTYRVRRGGSWVGTAGYCRVSDRYDWYPVYRYYDIGFRLASSPQ